MKNKPELDSLCSVEICAGGGGQALGLEQAGFEHAVLVENDIHSCDTLRTNRPHWHVIEGDVRNFKGKEFEGIDLLAGGVPCPPFSIASKQLGSLDERDLFPEALRLAREISPKAIMLENVRGFATKRFSEYRNRVVSCLNDMGYCVGWRVINSYEYGVPQIRPRFILIALKEVYAANFYWPATQASNETVGSLLNELMGSNGWPGAKAWSEKANAIAPTIVGGSKKHGGPDLGPTRAKRQWELLCVDGKGIANEPPNIDFPFDGYPKLTNEMVAMIQGFPKHWKFSGKKTSIYRQIGNAFPPPVAKQIGVSIKSALLGEESHVRTRFTSKLEDLPLFEAAI